MESREQEYKDFILKMAQPVIKDIEYLIEAEPEGGMARGQEFISNKQLLKEVSDLTDFGKHYIANWHSGVQRLLRYYEKKTKTQVSSEIAKKLTLGEFIKTYIEPNSIIRLVYKEVGDGYNCVSESFSDNSMEWEVLKGKGKYRHYINNKVLGIACIAISGHYPETINIVIEKLENQPQVEETIEPYEHKAESLD